MTMDTVHTAHAVDADLDGGRIVSGPGGRIYATGEGSGA